MICKTKCFYKNHLWEVGDTLIPEKGEKVPEHFVEEDEFVPKEKELIEEPKTFAEILEKKVPTPLRANVSKAKK